MNLPSFKKIILQHLEKHNACELVLNNPDKHNAFDDQMLNEIKSCLEWIGENYHQYNIQSLLLSSNGKSFSSGADLAWMQKMVNFSEQENLADARLLAGALARLRNLPIPTVCKIQGAAFGGGIGLIACADIAITVDDAKFCFSEAKLGLAPAVISPFIIQAIGARQTNALFLTAATFGTSQALDMGLVHHVASKDKLDHKTFEVLEQLNNNGKEALVQIKELVHRVAEFNLDNSIHDYTTELIAKMRIGQEAQSRLKDFLVKN